VLQHFKNDPVRRRKARDIEENVQSVDFIPTSDVQNVMTINQTNPGQVHQSAQFVKICWDQVP
jgi:hypothetical protein